MRTTHRNSTHSNLSRPPLSTHYDPHPSFPPTLSTSHPHSLRVVAKDSLPAKALAVTNVIDLDNAKLYCSCGNYNSGYIVGTRPESDAFCESSRLGQDSSIRKKTGEGVAIFQRIKDVIMMGNVIKRGVLVEGRETMCLGLSTGSA